MQYETLYTIKNIKQQINKIKNIGRVKSIEKRCKRLLVLYYHVCINYK